MDCVKKGLGPMASFGLLSTVELHLSGHWLSLSPIIRIGSALRLNLSRIQKKKTSFEIPGCRIKYNTVLWLAEL